MATQAGSSVRDVSGRRTSTPRVCGQCGSPSSSRSPPPPPSTRPKQRRRHPRHQEPVRSSAALAGRRWTRVTHQTLLAPLIVLKPGPLIDPRRVGIQLRSNGVDESLPVIRRIHTVSATSERDIRFRSWCGGSCWSGCVVVSSVAQASLDLGVSRSTGWIWWRDAGAMELRIGRAGGVADLGDRSRPGGRGHRLSNDERFAIMRGRDAGLSHADIAELIGRDRNADGAPGWPMPARARPSLRLLLFRAAFFLNSGSLDASSRRSRGFPGPG